MPEAEEKEKGWAGVMLQNCAEVAGISRSVSFFCSVLSR